MKRLFTLLSFALVWSLCYANIPIDFSRVGYMWGEKAIPDYPVYIMLTAPEDGRDFTSLLQLCLNQVPSGGAILLKEGVYNISGTLKIERNDVVIRGEGPGTILKAAGTQKRTLITLGKKTERVIKDKTAIKGDFTPAGQMWVRVADPSKFSVGSRVAICFEPSEEWIHELKMDQVAQNAENRVKPWKPSDYVMRWERIVTAVKGGKIWLDNPVAMQLEKKYAESISLELIEWDRISGCGIENLSIVCDYDKSVVMTKDSDRKFHGEKYPADEKHAWIAIEGFAAEHCWIRNVTTRHFGYAHTCLRAGSKNITVRDCVSDEPVSELKGSRRDAFHIHGAELVLVENCVARYDRHGFILGTKTPGPNVFLNCTMEHAYSDAGPHQRWSTAVLFDNLKTDELLQVQDRAGWGTGQGWGGVNFVFWNCVAETLICQNPWISGKNWCIGCIGEKIAGRPYDDGLVRPDGEWESHGKHVTPASLYRTQLSERQEKITEILGK